MDLSAIVMELLQHGIRNGAAHAAAHNGDLLLALGLGGLAQGAHEVCQAIAFLHVAELHSGSANRLNNDGDGALFGIIGVDGDGDTLAVFIRPQDDKLTGLSLFGNEGRFDLIESYGGPQCLFSHDSVHIGVSSFPI